MQHVYLFQDILCIPNSKFRIDEKWIWGWVEMPVPLLPLFQIPNYFLNTQSQLSPGITLAGQGHDKSFYCWEFYRNIFYYSLIEIIFSTQLT